MELGSNFNFLVFTELVPTDVRVAMLLGLLSLCVWVKRLLCGGKLNHQWKYSGTWALRKRESR